MPGLTRSRTFTEPPTIRAPSASVGGEKCKQEQSITVLKSSQISLNVGKLFPFNKINKSGGPLIQRTIEPYFLIPDLKNSSVI